MAESKPKHLLQSKTIIGGIVMLLPALASLLGVTLASAEVGEAAERALRVADDLNELIGFALVVWGRVTASRPVAVLPGGGGTAGRAAAVLLAALLVGCAAQPRDGTTPAQALAAAEVSYQAVLRSVNAVLDAGAVKPDDAARLRALLEATHAALESGRAAVRGGAADAALRAAEAAQAAVGAMRDVVPRRQSRIDWANLYGAPA